MSDPAEPADIPSCHEECRNLKGLAAIMKWMMGGAVGLGVWAGGLQLQVLATSKHEAVNGERIRELELRSASERERLQNIYDTLRRIADKLNL